MSRQWYARRVWVGVVAAIVSAGCSSQPKVLPAQPHAPSSPDKVKLYQSGPAKYEQLGTIMLVITPQYQWDEKGDATPAFDAMKQRAAAEGANGVLLEPLPGQSNARALASYHGQYFKVPVKSDVPRVAVGQAIYVHDE